MMVVIIVVIMFCFVLVLQPNIVSFTPNKTWNVFTYIFSPTVPIQIVQT